MDLTAWLLRHTAVRPLVLTVPGGTTARFAVERHARARGWARAVSPAEANVLVVAGSPGTGLEPYLRRVWESLPAPKARAGVPSMTAAEATLDAAAAELRDVERQREHARQTVHSDPEPEMADRGPDRDGLALDRVTVPLGPALPDWPPGLVVHTVLQGDVIQSAEVELLGLDSTRPEPVPPSARLLDDCATLLTVAGAPDLAATARRLRDSMDRAEVVGEVRGWAARVRRSPVLRWSLAGIAPAGDDAPARLAGDALARLYRMVRSISDGSSAAQPAEEAQWTVDALPRLLEGSELAVARLTVASLAPGVELLAGERVNHG